MFMGYILTKFHMFQLPTQWRKKAVTTEVKRPGLEAKNSYTSNAEVKNARRYTSTLPILHSMVFN
jgi:hypothetical protein